MLSSCIILEPEEKILTNKKKEDYLILIADAVDNLPEPTDAFSYLYISDSHKIDYREYDNKQGCFISQENGNEYYKDGYMYNVDGKYKYNEDFKKENERANVLNNAFFKH